MKAFADGLVLCSFLLNFGAAIVYAATANYNLSLYWTGGSLLVGAVWWRSVGG